MRTALVGLLGWAAFVAVTSVGLPPAAAEPSPIPIQPPKPVPSAEPSIAPRPQQPPFVGGVRRTPPRGFAPALAAPSAYADGPMSFDAEIVNPTTSPITSHLRVERVGSAPPDAQVARVSVNVAAGERGIVTFVDGLGLKNGCSSTVDRLVLETEGSAPKKLRITPACSFTAEGVDPAVVGTGDAGSIAPAPRDRLTYHSASITTPSLACGGSLSVRAIVRNNTKTLAQGVRLRLDGPRGFGGAIAAGATDPFDVSPNKELPVFTTLTGFAGEPGAYTLRIDPMRAIEPHQPGWHARVTRSCRLDVALEK